MKMVMIGFGNSVSAAHVVAVVTAGSAPIKRVVQQAREQGCLVDATCGRRMRTVIAMDSGHVVLSALTAETITGRMDPQSAMQPAAESLDAE